MKRPASYHAYVEAAQKETAPLEAESQAALLRAFPGPPARKATFAWRYALLGGAALSTAALVVFLQPSATSVSQPGAPIALASVTATTGVWHHAGQALGPGSSLEANSDISPGGDGSITIDASPSTRLPLRIAGHPLVALQASFLVTVAMDAHQAPTAEVVVYKGAVELSTPKGLQRVAAGERYRWQEDIVPVPAAPPEQPHLQEPRRRTSQKAIDKSVANDVFGEAAGLLDTKDCPAIAALSTQHAGLAPRLKLMLAECYLQRSEEALALSVYDGVAKQAPRESSGETAAYEGARLVAKQGNNGEALTRFETFIKNYPKSSLAGVALYRSCELYAGQQSHAKAIDCLNRYRKKYTHASHSADAALLLAALYYQDARYREAAELYMEALPSRTDEDVWYRALRALQQAHDARLAELQQRYLQKFGSSRRAAEVKALTP